MANDREIIEYVQRLNFSKDWAKRVASMPFNQVFAIYSKYKNISVSKVKHPEIKVQDPRPKFRCKDCGTIFFMNDGDYIKNLVDNKELRCICPECCGIAEEI